MPNFYQTDLALTKLPLDKTASSLLEEKEYFYIAANSVQALSRFSNLQQVIASTIQEGQQTVSNFNRVIESYLITLLNISTISSLDNITLSPHYKKTKLLTNQTPSLDPSYLQEVMYSNSKTWGGQFGTLSYLLHRARYINHYSTPSQLVAESIKQLSKEQIDNSNKELLSNINLLSLSDSLQSDIDLYKTSIQFLSTYQEIKDSLTFLSFLEDWLPRCQSIVLNDIRQGNNNLSLTNKNTEEAYNLLFSINQKTSSLLMDEASVKNIQFRFIHNDFPIPYLNIHNLLESALNTSQYNPEKHSNNKYEDLVKELLDFNISRFNTNLLRVSTNKLSNILYPGGYNLLLLSISAALLNKAFILTNGNFSNLILGEDSIPSDDLGRWLRLLYLSGYCLKKSNLYSLNTIGSNLIALSSIEDNTPEQITDLTL